MPRSLTPRGRRVCGASATVGQRGVAVHQPCHRCERTTRGSCGRLRGNAAEASIPPLAGHLPPELADHDALFDLQIIHTTEALQWPHPPSNSWPDNLRGDTQDKTPASTVSGQPGHETQAVTSAQESSRDERDRSVGVVVPAPGEQRAPAACLAALRCAAAQLSRPAGAGPSSRGSASKSSPNRAQMIGSEHASPERGQVQDARQAVGGGVDRRLRGQGG